MFNLFLAILTLLGTVLFAILNLILFIFVIAVIGAGMALVIDFAIMNAKSIGNYIKSLVRKHGGK